MKKDLKEKVDIETKKQVRKELAPELKKLILERFHHGALKKALASVKKNNLIDIQNAVNAKLKKAEDKEVDTKLPSIKDATLVEMVKKMKDQLFDKYKAAGAMKLQNTTKTMPSAEAKAVELDANTKWKTKAKQNAKSNANVEMKLKVGPHLKKGLQERIAAKYKASAASQIKSRILALAKKHARNRCSVSIKTILKQWRMGV